MTRPTALYLRCSTSPQMEKFGPSVQRELVNSYAQRMGLSITGTYEDAISGTKARRDALDQLLIEAPRYEAVVISSVDRLARRVRIAYGVLDELAEAGLEVHSADMGLIDLEDESSGMSFGLRSVMADAQHRQIVKRMHAAKVAKVRAGEPIKPLNGFGWKQGVIDEAEAAWLRLIFDRIRSVGANILARELNTQGVTTRSGRRWSKTTVLQLITNPVYMGEYRYGRGPTRRGRIKAVCQVEAIISPALWQAANEAVQRRATSKGRTSSLEDFPLSGRLTCGTCGRSMGGVSVHRKSGMIHRYYACNSRYAEVDPCPHRTNYPAEKVHAAVMEELEGALRNPADLERLIDLPTPQAPDLGHVERDAERRLSRLEAAYDAGAYTAIEYAERRRALQAEREALTQLVARVAVPAPDLKKAARALEEALRSGKLALAVAPLGLRGVLQPGGDVEIRIAP
ncbi:recombinase family protein [Deinococcus irradiatisoli]|nr:recombinase family protein [Deinococcus irradiatisoli]